jgi:thioredoxin 1
MMQLSEFHELVKMTNLPIVVEFWAEWCGPCRAMAPQLQSTEKAFEGKVQLVRVNADESPEILRELNVMGIPTVIGYASGKQVARKTGYMGEPELMAFFEAVEKGESPVFQRSLMTRIIYLVAGAALIVAGVSGGTSWLLIVLGVLVAIYGIWDRCPIISAIRQRLSPK